MSKEHKTIALAWAVVAFSLVVVTIDVVLVFAGLDRFLVALLWLNGLATGQLISGVRRLSRLVRNPLSC